MIEKTKIKDEIKKEGGEREMDLAESDEFFL
jgi:hypothetical protein